MREEEALNLVKEQAKLANMEHMKAEKVKDFDNYWYVSCTNEAGRPVGGYAYVVDIETKTIYAVPCSMPAHFNLRSVASGDAVELYNLPKHNKKDNSAS